MTKLSLFIAMTLFTNLSFGSVRAFNASNVDLGHFAEVKCSTGVTCTSSSGKLNIVSSPSLTGPLTLESAEEINNTTDDTVQIKSNDETTTLNILGFEAKNAVLELWADQGDDAADKYSLTADTSDNLTIKNNTTALLTFSSAGAMSAVGSLTGDGGDALSGFLQKQVASTTTTLTAAQCGSTIVNDSADVVSLPEASTVLGCRYTFIVGNVSNFDVNPDDADQIVLLTNAAGDAIRADAIGESVVLEAISASAWAPVGAEKGTWSDIN